MKKLTWTTTLACGHARTKFPSTTLARKTFCLSPVDKTMKPAFLCQLFAHRPRQIAILGCCLTALLLSVRSVQAQFAQQTGTNNYNFYAYNGTTSASEGTDPDPGGPLGGEPLGYPTYFAYSESGTIPPTGLVTINATVVTASASFTLGPNPTGAGAMTVTLTNPNSLPDEVRLDWGTIYINNGSATPIVGFQANISGSLTGSGSYYALAGGETIIYGINSYTATLQNSFTHAGLGAGPWYGGLGPGTFSATSSAFFSSGGPTVAHGDTIAVAGYLDLVVDPGTIQVQLEALQTPAVGICIYSNSPVVFFPTTPGTNYVLQMTTNLVSPNWVTVTNGVPFSGVEITNAPSPAFFRLQ
jgi:hypothetical protein